MSAHIGHLRKGNMYFDEGNWIKAIEEYTLAHELEYRIKDGWINRGFSYEYIGNFKEAIKCYTHLLNMNPDRQTQRLVWNFKGRAQYSLGRCDLAIDSYQNAIKIDPRFLMSWYNLAQALFCLQVLDKTVDALGRALKLNPQHQDSRVLLGKALHAMERYVQALQEYDSVLNSNPKHIDALYNKGYSLGSLDRFEEAVACFDYAILQEQQIKDDRAELLKLPRRPDLKPEELTIIAQGYLETGNIKKAEEFVNRSLASGKESSQSTYIKGSILKRQGKLEEASKYINKALELDPLHEKASAEMANINIEMDTDFYEAGLEKYTNKNFKGAMADFEKLLEKEPDHIDGLFLRGMCQYHLKKPLLAQEIFLKVQSKDPEFKSKTINKLLREIHRIRVEQELSQILTMAKSTEQMRNYEQALNQYQEAINLDDASIDANQGYANCLFELKRIEEADTAYRRVLALDPQNTLAQQRLDKIADQLRSIRIAAYKREAEETADPATAIAAYQEILKLDPYYNEAEQKIKELQILLFETRLQEYFDTGVSFMKQEKYTEAIEQFDKVIAHEQNVDALFHKVTCLRRLEQYGDAILVIETILKIDPDHFDATIEHGDILAIMEEKKTQDLLRRADEAFDSSNYPHALELYSKVLEFSPQNEHAWMRTTEIEEMTRMRLIQMSLQEIDDLEEQGELEQAVTKIGYLVEQYPENEQIQSRKEELQQQYKTKRNDMVLLEVEKLIRISNFDRALQLLEESIAEEENEELLAKLEEIEKLRAKDFVEKQLIEFTMLKKNKQYDEAMGVILILLENDPDNLELQQKVQEIEELREKDQEETINNTVLAYLENEEYDEAILYLQTIQKENDTSAIQEQIDRIQAMQEERNRSNLLELIRQLKSDGMYRDALDNLEQALVTYPDDTEFIDLKDEISSLLEDAELMQFIQSIDRMIEDRNYDEAINALMERGTDKKPLKMKYDEVIRAKENSIISEKIKKLDTLIEETEYEQALTIISNMNESLQSRDDIQSRQNHILKLIKQKEAEQLLNEVEELIANKQYDEAENKLQSSLQEDPENSAINQKLEEVQTLKTKTEMEESMSNILLMLDENNDEEAKQAILIFQERFGETEESKQLLVRIDEKQREEQYQMHLRELDVLIDEDIERALERAEELLELYPSDELEQKKQEILEKRNQQAYQADRRQLDTLVENEEYVQALELLEQMLEVHSDLELLEIKQLIESKQTDGIIFDALQEIDKLIADHQLFEAKLKTEELEAKYPNNDSIQDKLEEVIDLLREEERQALLLLIDQNSDAGQIPMLLEKVEQMLSTNPDDVQLREAREKLLQLQEDQKDEELFNTVVSLMREGKYSEARVHLTTLQDKYPDDERITIWFAELESHQAEGQLKEKLDAINDKMEQNQYEEAYELVLAFEQEYPDQAVDQKGVIEKKLVQQYIDAGRANYNNKKYTECSASMDKALNLDPDNIIANYYKGLAEKARKRNQTAHKAFDNVIRVDKQHAPSYYEKGDLYLKENKLEKAVEYLQQSVELAETNPESMEIIPEDKVSTFVETAKSSLEKGEQKLTKFYLDNGNTYFKKRQYKNAIDAYEKMLIFKPNDKFIWNNLGLAYKITGKYAKAMDCYTKAIDLDPDFKNAHNNAGSANAALGKHEEALKSYDEAIRVDPKYHQALNNKGLSLHELGRYDEAVEEYKRSIEANPKYKNPYSNMGTSLATMKKHKEAVEAFEKALDLDPKYLVALSGMGISLIELNEYDQALEFFDRALSLNPKELLSLYGKALIHDIKEEYPQALNLLNDVLKLNGKYGPAWTLKGKVEFDKGDFAKSIKSLTEAKKHDNNPDIDKLLNVARKKR
ncbi:MAG: tetratricopeptide repeat protein [Candidatus Heimdallarchaeota archaeon]|nr:tetratricopeptide repeat protein [Candidatus Heimdallarchaeota archaeon]